MWESQRQLWAFVVLGNVLVQTVIANPFYVPQFLSGGVGRNIRHLPCVSRRTGDTGVCMFAFTCAKANGTHLGTCIDRFYFGSCCKIDDEPDMFPQDNSIDDGPHHPSRPFVTTHAPIESNDIPEYFSRPKPIVEKKPPGTHATATTTYVTGSTQASSSTSSQTTRTTTKKPEQTFVESTTQPVRLSTFQTVQDASTKRVTTTELPLKTTTKSVATTQRPIITVGSSTTARPSPASSSSSIFQRPATSNIPTKPTITSFTVQSARPTTRKPSHSSTVHRPSTQRPTSSTSYKPSQSTTNKISQTATARPQTTTTRSVATTTQKYVPSTRFPLRNTTTTLRPSTQTATKKPTISSTKRPSSTRRPSVTTRKPSTPTKRPTITGKPLTGSTFAGKPILTTTRPQTTVKVRPPVVTVTESSSTLTSRPAQSAQPSTLTVSTLTTSKFTAPTTRKPTERITTTTRRPIEQKTTTTRRPVEQKTTTRRPVEQKTTTSRPVEQKTTVRTTLKPTVSTTKQKPTRLTTTQKIDYTTIEATTTPSIFTTNVEVVTEKVRPASSTVSETRPKPTKPTKPASIGTKPSTVGTKPSSIGTKPSTVGTRPSSVGTRPSSVGTRPSSVGTKPSTVGTKPSTVGTKPSTVGTKPSSIGTKPSTITTKPSTITTKPTTIPTKPSTTTRVTTTTTKVTTTTASPTTVTLTTSTETTTASVSVAVTTDVSTNGTTTSTVSPLKVPDANQTLEEIPQTTYSPGLVTWSSNSDLLATKVPESSTLVAEQEEQTETEWTPITTPDGWIIIQSPTTERLPQTQEETTTKPVTEPTVQHLTSARPVTESTTEYATKKPTMPTSQTTMTSVTIDTELPVPMETLNMSDYKQVCGRRLFPEPRIVGGKPSSFGKWPWQISLRQWRTSTYLHKCGAALLNENWAITAAHCVENVPPSDLLLRIGEHDLANEDEPYGYQERRVQIVASHPQFDPRTFEYDLALLRFYEPLVPFQPNVLPICLPDDDENYVGRSAYVTGWGRLYDEGPLPSVLQEVEVPVINNSVCESMYRNAGYIEHIPNIFICAGWKNGGFDSCEGDSGGPMVIQRARDKRWILAGVISWGIGCAVPNQPGVYTRISEFRDWINQILQF